jgi:hypothetical protein
MRTAPIDQDARAGRRTSAGARTHIHTYIHTYVRTYMRAHENHPDLPLAVSTQPHSTTTLCHDFTPSETTITK